MVIEEEQIAMSNVKALENLEKQAPFSDCQAK